MFANFLRLADAAVDVYFSFERRCNSGAEFTIIHRLGQKIICTGGDAGQNGRFGNTLGALVELAPQLEQPLTLGLAILGFYAGSKALLAGTFFTIPGIWIWVLRG